MTVQKNIEILNANTCIVCGYKLAADADKSSEGNCQICGEWHDAAMICPEGHYICRKCFDLDILGKVERFLYNSTEKDPVLLAVKVFDLPGLPMHCKEYHSIVPAVIIAAYQNLQGRRDADEIAEAIKRGKYTEGASCGFSGSCGACVGSGVAVSIIEKANPLSKEERGHAQVATATALLEISQFEGPRCCKRESITTIKSFAKVTGCFDEEKLSEYVCKQYRVNKDCIYAKCPYFSGKK